MNNFSIFVLYLVILSYLTKSECPNACSGQGTCGANDMCTCYQKFTDGDCSSRICQFGRAHVDIPLGDLDSSKKISGPNNIVIKGGQIYPHGTTEQFPNLIDSSRRKLSNTGHSYTECSSKGICDRTKGICNCVPGYTGSACQKTSCPIVNSLLCSGHGICESAKYFASQDDSNLYELWDREMTYGCYCDHGFYGPSCSLRRCKIYYDPIYIREYNSHRFSNWSLVIAKTTSMDIPIIGNYSIVVYDANDEDWVTEPIPYGASCDYIINTLEKLPNDVFPFGSVRCLMWDNYHSISPSDEPVLFPQGNPFYGIKYTLAFPSNPGILKQIDLNLMLDGKRPSLYTTESNSSSLQYFIYPNGFHGETTDYFTPCSNIDVNILSFRSGNVAYSYLSGLTSLETRLFRQCLGASNPDFTSLLQSGRVQGQDYQWQYGNVQNPHFIKLVDKTPNAITDLCNRSVEEFSLNNSSSVRGAGRNTRTCSFAGPPPGFLVLVIYDPSVKRFKLMSNIPDDYSSTTSFAVHTTSGVVQLTSPNVQVFTSISNPYSRTVYLSPATSAYPSYKGNIDCETTQTGQYAIYQCVEKGDRVMIIDPSFSKSAYYTNPKYMNLYTVKKIFIEGSDGWSRRLLLDMSINGGWQSSSVLSSNVSQTLLSQGRMSFGARLYIFRPPPVDGVSGYQYVSECSNRGQCNTETGLCNCFAGYTGDACVLQDPVLVTTLF